jgi:hypothetical protein
MAVAQILDENLNYIRQKFVQGLKTSTNSLALGNGAESTADDQVILQSGGNHTIDAPQNPGFYVIPLQNTSSTDGFMEEVRYNPNTSEFRIVSGTGNAILHESGNVTFKNLPTSDPGSEGQVWNDQGTLKISSG